MLPVRAPRRDPAPSRLRYRLTRLWLRPAIRRTVNVGLPALAVGLTAWTLAEELRLRERVVEAVAVVRAAIVERPEFMITRLEIPGVSADLAEQIREASLVVLPVNSLQVDVASVRQRVERLDAVQSARVRALPGGALSIQAVERVPVVLWRSAAGLELLDRDGVRVAEVDSRLRRPDLPLIAGEGADRHVAEALSLLADAAAIAPRIRGLVRVGERRWDLVLDRDRVVRLPEEAPGAALTRVMALHAAEDLLGRDLTVVDFRIAERPLLRLSEHALSEIARLRGLEAGEDA